MAWLVADRAGRAGLPEAKAELLAMQAFQDLRREFGGTNFYIPKGAIKRDERAAELYALHQAGKSVREIAAETALTTIYVYRLLAQERARLEEIRQRRR